VNRLVVTSLTLAALLAWPAVGREVEANSPFEATVQHALETLPSGDSAAAQIDGSRFSVMPTRTWKSVSGHYCRVFELTVLSPGGTADRAQGMRCRDGDGMWKQVSGD